MSNSSNQYIQKISLEHPIALWSLDDEAYYIKLMSDSGRDIGNWEDINVASITNIEPTDINLPNPNRPCTRIIGQDVGTEYLNASAFVLSNETFSASSKPFSISFNLYSEDTDIRFCKVGYQIGNEKSISGVSQVSGQASVVYTSTAHGFVNGDYVTVTGTVPNGATVGAYDAAGVVIKITNDTFRITDGIAYNESLAADEAGGKAFKGEEKTASDAWLSGRSKEWLFLSQTFDKTVANAKIRIKIMYDGDFDKTFLINDLSIGQGSIEFASRSSGQTAISIPDTIATTETHAVVAKDYASIENNAYYIVKDNILCSKNSSIPMAFGSLGTTVLSSNNNGPSLIFPGFGMLNEYGRYKEYNLETFLRVNGKTLEPKRIIGPINSEDGVYVNGSFIILKINNLYKTAYIGEWFKPMLINLQYTANLVELWVNADKLISIDITDQTIIFPSKTTEEGADQDWIGFYSYDDFSSIEVDTVTIYPYVADQTLLKRRLLYAQGVSTSSLENLAIQSSGKFVNFRYDVAGYDKNYNFPTFANWNSSQVFDNLSVVDNVLYSKSYNLPDAYLGSKTYEEWKDDQEDIQDEASNFISLKPNEDYDDVGSYIYFNSQNVLEETLSAIYAVVKKPESSITEQRLITIYDTALKDYFKISLTDEELSYVLNVSGVDVSETIIENVPMDTKISVGINFDTMRQSLNTEVSNFFKRTSLAIYVGGIPQEDKTFDGKIYKVGLCNYRSASEISSSFTNGMVDYTEDLEDNVATYTLFSKEFLGKFILDIQTKSYWESSVFLSSLSAYKDEELGLDFFQINIDYPESTTIVDNKFDTSSEFIKSSISFQSNVSGLEETDFNQLERLPTSKIIDAKTDWELNQYDFIDSTIVYPPTDIDIQNYSLVVHLTMISHVMTYPTQIKYLEFASKSAKGVEPGVISSESSEQVQHYFINENNVEDYTTNSGVFVTKDSTSYLNLKNNSGVGVVNLTSIATDTLVKFPISTQATEAIMVIFKTQGVVDETKTIFEISVNNSEYSIEITPSADSNKNTLVFKEFSGLFPTDGRLADLYINGKLAPINNAEISLNEWTSLIIKFRIAASADSSSYFSVRGVTKTNVSLFSSYGLPLESKKESVTYNTWDDIDDITWNDYYDSNIWLNVFASIVDVSSFSGVGRLWETFLGRNVVVQQEEEFFSDENSILQTGQYRYKTYLNTKRQSLYQNPA